jgi:hypothetical protein
MDICIIGSGWYGLHIALLLQDKHNITILEKENDIFCKSSYYNQNRLHLGYHYPRCEKTIKMCKTNYDLFIEKYYDVVETIDNNIYFISIASNINVDVYKKIYKRDENITHTVISNKQNIIQNVYEDYFDVNEKIINNKKAKLFFIKHINNKCKIIKNYNVASINQADNKCIINGDSDGGLIFDKIIDCTNNQLQLSKFKYKFEKTVSFIYQKIQNINNLMFNAITIMDGLFFSLYPIDSTLNLYTLTHVKYTPLDINTDYNNLVDYLTTQIDEHRNQMENDVLRYFPDFYKYFKYVDYFISNKTKLFDTEVDSRECIIEETDNIISVNCGKISGIFEFEKYIKQTPIYTDY